MNNINFNQLGGFPLETNTLDEMQNAYKLFNALGQIAGNFTFISGGIVTGTSISNGVVYINGEVLEFKGGALAPTIVIVEEIEKQFFENGEEKPVFHRRYAKCGSGVTTFPFANFKRGFETKEIQSALDKKEDKINITTLTKRLEELERKTTVFQQGGGMVLWNKPANQIPQGWREVKNWEGRMPIGAGKFNSSVSGWLHDFVVGGSGGDTTNRMTIDQMPSHSHGLGTVYRRGSASIFKKDTLDESDGSFRSRLRTEVEGSGTPFSILNPYRVVLFIEYIG